MSRRCELTGKRPVVGNRVSNANNRRKTRHLPSLHKKRLFLEPLKQAVTLKLSTRAIRTVDKVGGLARALLTMNEAYFSDRAKKLKRLVRARCS